MSREPITPIEGSPEFDVLISRLEAEYATTLPLLNTRYNLNFGGDYSNFDWDWPYWGNTERGLITGQNFPATTVSTPKTSGEQPFTRHFHYFGVGSAPVFYAPGSVYYDYQVDIAQGWEMRAQRRTYERYIEGEIIAWVPWRHAGYVGATNSTKSEPGITVPYCFFSGAGPGDAPPVITQRPFSNGGFNGSTTVTRDLANNIATIEVEHVRVVGGGLTGYLIRDLQNNALTTTLEPSEGIFYDFCFGSGVPIEYGILQNLNLDVGEVAKNLASYRDVFREDPDDPYSNPVAVTMLFGEQLRVTLFITYIFPYGNQPFSVDVAGYGTVTGTLMVYASSDAEFLLLARRILWPASDRLERLLTLFRWSSQAITLTPTESKLVDSSAYGNLARQTIDSNTRRLTGKLATDQGNAVGGITALHWVGNFSESSVSNCGVAMVFDQPLMKDDQHTLEMSIDLSCELISGKWGGQNGDLG